MGFFNTYIHQVFNPSKIAIHYKDMCGFLSVASEISFVCVLYLCLILGYQAKIWRYVSMATQQNHGF